MAQRELPQTDSDACHVFGVLAFEMAFFITRTHPWWHVSKSRRSTHQRAVLALSVRECRIHATGARPMPAYLQLFHACGHCQNDINLKGCLGRLRKSASYTGDRKSRLHGALFCWGSQHSTQLHHAARTCSCLHPCRTCNATGGARPPPPLLRKPSPSCCVSCRRHDQGLLQISS